MNFDITGKALNFKIHDVLMSPLVEIRDVFCVCENYL
jgi:hypothetical protein